MELREIILCIVASVLVLTIPAALKVGSSHYEAKAYKKVTGIEVSTWDAMFLRLRVDGCEQIRRND